MYCDLYALKILSPNYQAVIFFDTQYEKDQPNGHCYRFSCFSLFLQ